MGTPRYTEPALAALQAVCPQVALKASTDTCGWLVCPSAREAILLSPAAVETVGAVGMTSSGPAVGAQAVAVAVAVAPLAAASRHELALAGPWAFLRVALVERHWQPLARPVNLL